MRTHYAAFALVFGLLGCGGASVEPDASADLPDVDKPLSCAHTNGAWCITSAQAAVTQDVDDEVHWTLLGPEDNSGLIVEPKSCRGRAADGVYRRSAGTVLREGENWKIARIGFREDRTCDVLFMAPESAADSLEGVFLTRVNVCLSGTTCSSEANMLAARLGSAGLF